MRRFLAAAGLAIGVTHLAINPVFATSDAEIQTRMETVITDVIRPGFAQFATEAETIRRTTGALCNQPAPETLAKARADFADLATAWAGVEFWRVGPLMQDNRLERVLFWPDRRGRGLRQVQTLLQQIDELANLTIKGLSEKSVAVQGLVALEFSLFGTGSDTLSTYEGSLRCIYVSTITRNMAILAQEVHTAWQPEGEITALLLNPGEGNPVVRDSDEQIGLLLRLIRDGVEVLAVQRISPIIRDDQSSARPKSALFWRSQNTIPMLRANLDAISAYSAALDIKPLLPEDQARRADSFAFELANAERPLETMNADLSGVASDDAQYGQLNYLKIVMGSLYSLLERDIPGALGLVSGFSTLDGD